MRSRKTGSALIVLPLMLVTGCASSLPAPVQRPAVPSEMMIPAPPPGYYTTTLELILSRLPLKLTGHPTDSEPAKP